MINGVSQTFGNHNINFPPNAIEMDFVFCEHDSPSKLPQEFGELASQADIIALETVGWTEEGVRLRQEVSNGSYDALQRGSELLPSTLQGAFWKKIHRKIFATQASIHYPDAPSGHEVATRYLVAVEQGDQALLSYYDNLEAGYSISPGILLSHLRKIFRATAERDRYIVEHLFPTDLERSTNNEVIRYLAMFGLLHRGIATYVKQQAEMQGRSDVVVRTIESGRADPTPYERYLKGITPTTEDIVATFNLPPILRH